MFWKRKNNYNKDDLIVILEKLNNSYNFQELNPLYLDLMADLRSYDFKIDNDFLKKAIKKSNSLLEDLNSASRLKVSRTLNDIISLCYNQEPLVLTEIDLSLEEVQAKHDEILDKLNICSKKIDKIKREGRIALKRGEQENAQRYKRELKRLTIQKQHLEENQIPIYDAYVILAHKQSSDDIESINQFIDRHITDYSDEISHQINMRKEKINEIKDQKKKIESTLEAASTHQVEDEDIFEEDNIENRSDKVKMSDFE